ncbi:50S ribosomal protein L9 [Spiroplasma endosymbiont of Notiophilus biguttatus]|uniref:50S ribosomal protein L9 n=1 Tax=Spiroplasma endosymbiont of Notiophilus biguttatus TaxID=3066285 RepID=UPI00313BF223
MKVVLLTDVKNYGKRGEVVNVSGGYGKNYLLPRKLAVIATSEALKINQKVIENKKIQREMELEDLQKIKEQLDLITLQFKLKSNNGKVFGAISSKQICEQLVQKYNIKIDKHKFVKFNPINELGITNINIKLDVAIIAQLKVEVLGE